MVQLEDVFEERRAGAERVRSEDCVRVPLGSACTSLDECLVARKSARWCEQWLWKPLSLKKVCELRGRWWCQRAVWTCRERTSALNVVFLRAHESNAESAPARYLVASPHLHAEAVSVSDPAQGWLAPAARQRRLVRALSTLEDAVTKGRAADTQVETSPPRRPPAVEGGRQEGGGVAEEGSVNAPRDTGGLSPCSLP